MGEVAWWLRVTQKPYNTMKAIAIRASLPFFIGILFHYHIVQHLNYKNIEKKKVNRSIF